MAGIVAVCAVVFHFWSPKKFIVPLSATVYGLVVITAGTLVIQSGGISSPFIALWMAVSVFAGLYGMYGLGIVFGLVNLYIIYGAVTGSIAREDLIIAAIAGELPMFISYMLWNGRESLEEARDHDVSTLNKTLEQESSKSDAVIEAIGDGVMVVGQTGEILLINPAAQQMTGWSSNDATHLHFESVLKLQDAKGSPLESALNPISRVLNVGQQVREKELGIITKSGKRIYAAFVVSPMGGSGDGAIAVFRDITKERDEENAQAEFISTASHEMRTPVASIEGYLGLALNPNTATIDEKARDFITKAHASAQHLGHLFQDLLDVSKADDGRLKENPSVIDVVDFMRDVVDSLRTKSEEKGLEITYKPDGSKTTSGTTVISPVLYTHVDKEHLREVADNLVDNAIKYTLEGSVFVDVTATDEYVRISIQDSGVGIPAEDVPHLFQKFYRVDNSDTREIGGTGLGLYLCRKLIESMDGRIWVESEFKKGSTFYVEIPRIDRAKASEFMEREAHAAQTTAPEVATAPNLGTVETSVEIPTPPPEAVPSTTTGTAPESTIVSEPTTVVPQPVVTAAPDPMAIPSAPVAPPETLAPEIPTPHRFGAVSYTPGAQESVPPPSTNPAPTPQLSPQPVAVSAPAAPQRANVPLTSLERDPSRYISRRPQG